MKTIICSHGFGVKADARGMFTELASELDDCKFVMFDYNEVSPNGDVTVASLDDQAKRLQTIIDEQDGEIDLLCHSQGCIVAGLVNLDKISEVILIAPPVNMSMQHVIDKLMKRPGSKLNVDGTSKFPRTDGSVTYLSKEYLESLENKEPMRLYQTIANSKPTIVIRATNDNVLGLTNIDSLSNIQLIDIPADHDFTGDARNNLIKSVAKIV